MVRADIPGLWRKEFYVAGDMVSVDNLLNCAARCRRTGDKSGCRDSIIRARITRIAREGAVRDWNENLRSYGGKVWRHEAPVDYVASHAKKAIEKVSTWWHARSRLTDPNHGSNSTASSS